ncbi:MAG: GNAT family N-acetyltransferase [Thermomicrobiales bacterium]|nr:GNAT family N-acetyltransferase [Thermomicrobiales bacterium]MCO5217919.1 GNAT family N-acetyltransferase [Thermomicrobiales bacterium]MCO5228860.1 GNAT family N-acetyltransferase [Thermomicrobiales bacterium]
MTYQTDRLTLRPIEERDVDTMLATRTIPEVVEFTYEPIWTREYAQERVARHARLSHEESPVFTRWMIELRESGTVIGDIYLNKDAELQGTTEIGYVIHPNYAGHGYATEAAREVLRIGFEEWGVHRIYARVDEDNTGSTRVCQHLGMRQEGRLIENDRRGDKWSTELVFAMLDREWKTRSE